jgi:Cyclic-phosphate processing Receiver domain
MAKKIAILEDNAERKAEMLRCLEDKFYQFEKRFFDTPAAMIGFFKKELPEVVAISLDHDFELVPAGDGKVHDPGTGREVADFLAQQIPSCPVIIHSSNSSAATAMEMLLQEANWPTYRVCPCGDLDWIAGAWLRTMRNAIVRSVKEATSVG